MNKYMVVLDQVLLSVSLVRHLVFQRPVSSLHPFLAVVDILLIVWLILFVVRIAAYYTYIDYIYCLLRPAIIETRKEPWYLFGIFKD